MTTTVQPTAGTLPAIPTQTAPTRRIVPALIDAMPVYVECSSWCTIDHVAQNLKFLEDVWHGSDGVDLSAPDGLGLVLFARLGTDPYSRKPERRGPFVVIDDGSDCVNLTPAQAEEFADSLLVFAAQVRAMARIVPSEVA